MNRKRKKSVNILFYIESFVIIILVLIIFKLLLPKSNEEITVVSEPSSQESIVEVPISTVEEIPIIEEEPSSVEVNPDTISGNTIDDGELNIVIFGDSIWDDERYYDGVGEQLAQMTGANVYNCAMGGTGAALVNESTDVETWDSRSLNGMTYIATGRADAYSQLDGYAAKDIIESIDFNKVDYFVFSYGLNDYFSSVDVMPEDLLDMTTYVGALRHGTQIMRQTYPQARYLIIAPTYCVFSNNEQGLVDSNNKDFGEGTLEAYVEGAALVAQEYNTLYLDVYHNFGINQDTASTYLKDGIHLTAEGRKLYAKQVADFINNLENIQ